MEIKFKAFLLPQDLLTDRQAHVLLRSVGTSFARAKENNGLRRLLMDSARQDVPELHPAHALRSPLSAAFLRLNPNLSFDPSRSDKEAEACRALADTPLLDWLASGRPFAAWLGLAAHLMGKEKREAKPSGAFRM
jgi:hypothetical protein